METNKDLEEEQFALELYREVVKEVLLSSEEIEDFIEQGDRSSLKQIEDQAERVALICFKLAKGFRKAKLLAFK